MAYAILPLDRTVPVSSRSGTMIRRSVRLLSALALAAVTQGTPAMAQESRPSYGTEDEQDGFSGEELDNLVGPIALYPDALLAQVLVAATFPDQVEEAARYVRANGTNGIDDQPWDVSVKAVAHYASAINMMADKLDWTSALGRAYALQSSDVMAAVQRLREMADLQGNLQSTPQQSVIREDRNYIIAPTQTRYIYVPVYDPYVVYTRPVFAGGFSSRYWSFGVGFPIGSWLSYDFNWRARSVYYNGWNVGYFGYAGGWRGRSRPFIEITNVYVHPRYRTVYYNRDVYRRRVVYRNIDRYPGVHRDTRFGRRDVGYIDSRNRGRSDGGRSDGGRYDGGRYDGGRNDGGRNDGGRRDVPDRNRYDGRDSRGNDRRDDVIRSAPVRPYDWNRSRDNRSASQPDNNRGGSGRDVSRDGTWGRDGNGGRAGNTGREVGDGRGGSLGQDGGTGRQVGDGRGGSLGRDANAGNGGNGDRGRDDSRSNDRGRPSDATRGPWQRNEQPMINPRRAEPQQQRDGGNGGNIGGPRGGQRGPDRQAREKPNY